METDHLIRGNDSLHRPIIPSLSTDDLDNFPPAVIPRQAGKITSLPLQKTPPASLTLQKTLERDKVRKLLEEGQAWQRFRKNVAEIQEFARREKADRGKRVSGAGSEV